jgi:hypothetical protein
VLPFPPWTQLASPTSGRLAAPVPSLKSSRAQELEAHGASAEYEAPYETKDLATALSVVVGAFAVTGPLTDILAGVRAFKDPFLGTQIKGLPEEAGRSIKERVTHLDELHADGSISADEHAQQRNRMLNEL